MIRTLKYLKKCSKRFAFVDSRTRNSLEAQVAAHFVQRLPLVRGHPCFHFGAQRLQVTWTMPQQRGNQLQTMSARHRSFDHVERAVYSAGDSERRVDASAQNSDATKTQIEIRRGRKLEVTLNLQFDDIKIHLVKTGKQNDCIGAKRVDLQSKVRERGEQRRQLYGDRDSDLAFYVSHCL